VVADSTAALAHAHLGLAKRHSVYALASRGLDDVQE
jgi:hypothetical protein